MLFTSGYSSIHLRLQLFTSGYTLIHLRLHPKFTPGYS